MSDTLDKISELERQLEQAREYDLLFDADTVEKMIKIIKNQRRMLVKTRKITRLRKQEVKKLQNAITKHKNEIERLDKRMVDAQHQATKAWSEVEELREKVERYEEFIRACRFAGEGGLPQLRKDANYLLKGEKVSMDLSKILRKN